MEQRLLGHTGLKVGLLGFGCGNVGGLMVRGTPADRERGVARAVELGTNYFDTAALYGDGQSETNLGQVLRTLRPPVYVGTKFRLAQTDLGNIPAAIGKHLDQSLGRLGLDSVDLFQLHNLIRVERSGNAVGASDVLDAIVPALDKLRQAGKIRFYGITALGDTDALHRVIGTGTIHTAQSVLNLLNPSGSRAVPAGFPAQDFKQVANVAQKNGTGIIVIRVAAGGAIAGTMERHPVAVPEVDPIATGPDYAADVKRSAAFASLVKEGFAKDLVEASLRFAASVASVSTILLGYSSLDHLEAATAAINRGPLPPEALQRLDTIWREMK
jgi:aryl-alcohol dehydrogenase-like predicted oxidoreductase